MRDNPLDREQAENLAKEICALDGVDGLYGGQFGEIAMLFPGNRVRGLHWTTPEDDKDTERLEIFVVAKAQGHPSLDDLASAIRDTAARLVDAPVDVTIADVR